MLESCERWFQLAGRVVRRGVAGAPGPVPGASPAAFPILVVQQGSFPVIVRVLSEQEELVSIFMQIPVPPEVRTRLSTAEPPLPLKVYLQLRKELLSSGRTGFNLIPPTAANVSQIEVIALNQEVSVKGRSGAEITRLLDATVEVATLAARAVSLLAPVVAGAPATTSTAPPPAPDSASGPGSMYR